MKKLCALVLFLSLVLVGSVSLATSTIDLSYFRENSNLYSIDVNNDSEVAFITTTLNAASRCFHHDNEHDQYYSTFESDILVHDYFSSEPYGVMRIWINYFAKDFLNINSVTFQIGGKDYTFTGCCENDWKVKLDNGGVEEQALIIASDSNWDFWSALIDILDPLLENGLDDFTPIPVILHGSRDVTITMDAGAAVDFASIVIGAGSSGVKSADAGTGTKLTVTDSK